jgi:hypothetical protein
MLQGLTYAVAATAPEAVAAVPVPVPA